MNTVKRGYSFQFARRPPHFCGVLASSVHSDDAHVLRGDEYAGKRSHRNRSSSPEPVRLLQPLLPRPQERRRPATYSRSQTPESRPDEKAVQDDHLKTDPLANMPRGLVYVAGSERRILSHPDSPPSQTILEIRIRRGGLSIQGPALWAVPGSPHFHTMHGCGSLPSETDGNPHSQLPQRLANFGPVAGSFDFTQDPPPQPLRLPGEQGQLCQEHTVTQPTGIIPGYSYRLSADDSYCLSGASHLDSASRGFQHRPSAQSFPEDAGPYGSGFAGTLAGSTPYATHPVLVEAEGSSDGLASRTPPRNGDSGLCIHRSLQHVHEKESIKSFRLQKLPVVLIKNKEHKNISGWMNTRLKTKACTESECWNPLMMIEGKQIQ